MKKFFVATALAVAFISAQATDIVDTAVAAGNFGIFFQRPLVRGF